MDFNDTSTKLGLIQDCEDLTSLGDTIISGNSTLLAAFTKNINKWYLRAVTWALEAADKWEWDDPNKTDFPIATTTLVAGQLDYTLPAAVTGLNLSTFWKLVRLEVKDNGGNYIPLTRIDEAQVKVGMTELEKTNGLPRFYREVGNSIELYPQAAAGSVTLTAGLKCWFQRSPTLFAASDTTKNPGIPEPYHQILSVGASFDYCSNHGIGNAASLKTTLAELKSEFQSFISGRNKDEKARVKFRKENYA